MATTFADIFKRIFLNENIRILIQFSLKFVPEGSIDNIPAIVWIMAWRQMDDKLLFEQMMTRLTEAYMWHLGEMS